jgi:hypothetical protein
LSPAGDWANLHELDDEGAWPEVVWEYADSIVNDGVLPHEDDVKMGEGADSASASGWKAGLGCD